MIIAQLDKRTKIAHVLRIGPKNHVKEVNMVGETVFCQSKRLLCKVDLVEHIFGMGKVLLFQVLSVGRICLFHLGRAGQISVDGGIDQSVFPILHLDARRELMECETFLRRRHCIKRLFLGRNMMYHTCGLSHSWPPPGVVREPHPWIRFIIYHTPCNDGLAAALVLLWRYSNVRLIGVNHDKLHRLDQLHPEVVKEGGVLFVDISPRFADLQRWNLMHYFVLDHHASEQKELAQIPDDHKRFDMNLSGVGLAWEFAFPQVPMQNKWLRVIQARDLYRLDQEPHTRELNQYIHLMKTPCSACFAEFLFRPLTEPQLFEAVRIGHLLDQERMKRVLTYVNNAVARPFRGLTVWVVNCTDRSCASDTGSELCQQHPQDVALMGMYDVKSCEWWCSLRSGPQGPDVSELAKSLGGGGHPRAAGFTHHDSSLETLFSEDLVPQTKRVKI